jgi:hypothetical protein
MINGANERSKQEINEQSKVTHTRKEYKRKREKRVLSFFSKVSRTQEEKYTWQHND